MGSPLLVIVSNLLMEDHKETSIATASPEMKQHHHRTRLSEKEGSNVNTVFKVCGYPEWSLNEVRNRMGNDKTERKRRTLSDSGRVTDRRRLW